MPPPKHPSRPSRAAGRQHHAAPKPTYNATDDDFPRYEPGYIAATLAPIPTIDRYNKNKANAQDRLKSPNFQSGWMDLFAATGPMLLNQLTKGITIPAPDELRYLTNDGNFHILEPSTFPPTELALSTAATVLGSAIERQRFNKHQTAAYVDATIKAAGQSQTEQFLDIPLSGFGRPGPMQNYIVKDITDQLDNDPRVASYFFTENGGHTKISIRPASMHTEPKQPVKRGRNK
jgi:hypothetical protein